MYRTGSEKQATLTSKLDSYFAQNIAKTRGIHVGNVPTHNQGDGHEHVHPRNYKFHIRKPH